MRLTLGKEEKLRHKNLIDGLFAKGTTVYDFPLRMTYRVLTDEELTGSYRRGVPDRIGCVQMLVTIPKKKLRRAVDRVRMRRLIRESYRLNRLPLKERINQDDGTRTVSVAFIYLSDEKVDFATIEKKMRKLLDRIAL